MYPYLPALTGAREIRVPLGEGDVLDLEAMAAEVTAATQLMIVCNPNNPTATHHPVAEIAAFLETVPSRVTVILDEAYIEFQTNDHPDASLDLLKDFPNLVVLRTYSKCLRAGGAAGRLRDRLLRTSAPRSTRCASRSASTRSPRRRGRRRSSIRTTCWSGSRTTVAERLRVQEGLRGLGLWVSESQSNFSWIDLGGRDEEAIIGGLAAADIAVRAGEARSATRVTSASATATADEDGRFLSAIANLLG